MSVTQYFITDSPLIFGSLIDLHLIVCGDPDACRTRALTDSQPFYFFWRARNYGDNTDCKSNHCNLTSLIFRQMFWE